VIFLSVFVDKIIDLTGSSGPEEGRQGGREGGVRCGP